MRIHILFTLIIAGLLFSSCRVSRNIQTSSVNVDSVFSHVKDSMEQVRIREVTDLRRMIEEMTSSGVTFVVDSCPERERIYALLDSAGKANYDKMRLEEKLKSLSNKVTISEKGAITAEGNIKAAYFTNSKLQEEIYRSEVTIDKLTQTNDSLTTQLTKAIKEKDKQVEKTFMPWWFWLLLPLSAVVAWIAKAGLDKWKQRRLLNST